MAAEICRTKNLARFIAVKSRAINANQNSLRMGLILNWKCFAILACICLGAPATAFAQAAQQTCSKMISEGRGGTLSQKECICAYRVARANLDDDIEELLFMSWRDGVDNTDALAALPNQQRVFNQMRRAKKRMQVKCIAQTQKPI